MQTLYGVFVLSLGFFVGGFVSGFIGNLFTEGAAKNIADFQAAIVNGDCANATAAPSVRSNLTTILGRTAAYKRAEVSWDEMLKTAERLEFDTKGLKD